MNKEFKEIKDQITEHFPSKFMNLRMGLFQKLEMAGGYSLSTKSFSDYIKYGTSADLQPLLTFITTALEYASTSSTFDTNTAPGSPERLAWIYSQLGVEFLADSITERLPKKGPKVIVEANFEDWYTDERAMNNTNYWDGYVSALSRNGWDAESIQAVGEQATDVIRRIADPQAEHSMSSRGLVVGYVQSGKTANFTAVTAKAIDAGYRLIIILAGTLDILRNQTQRRLDKELIGKEAILAGRDEGSMSTREKKDETYFNHDEEWDRDWDDKGGAFISHGRALGTPGFPRIRRLTTSVRDYQHSGFNRADVEIPDGNKNIYHPDNLDNMPCMVAVVKKNASVLENLVTELSRSFKSKEELKHLPVLVIDDESDQASINTKNNTKKAADEDYDRTAVNKKITELLQTCPRAQYVGYTATPFANVFVDPEDPEDLYPRHFVLMLNEPPSYRGAKWFHDRMEFSDNPEDATIENSQSKAFIRDLQEADELPPEDFEETRDEELQKALDMFVLTGALKKFREAKHNNLTFKHHTMLVHEGVNTEIHTNAKEKLEALWNARCYDMGTCQDHLKSLYEKDVLPVMQVERYSDGYAVPDSFEELAIYISEAVSEMTHGLDAHRVPIMQVDTQGKDSPNFETGKVWKVLVGGAKLSRGYTVEGLTVSYFRRRAGGADTLMQTGRWFGFRKGYQDLVRLYAPPSLVTLFEAAMHDEEIFRDNIKAYCELGEDNQPKLTPSELAPLVQQSLPDLKPTSRNKMFNAKIKSIAPAPRAIEFNSIPDRNSPALAQNFRSVALPLLKELDPEPYDLAYFRVEGLRMNQSRISVGTRPMHVGTMEAQKFISIFESMKWYEGSEYKANNVRPVLEYVKGLMGKGKHANPTDSDFNEVAILLPVKTGMKSIESIAVEGINFPVPLVSRSRRENRHDITGTDRKYTYVMESIAMGEQVGKPRKQDLNEYYRNPNVKNVPDNLPEPLDLDPDKATKRGAVLLTLFDDRPKEAILLAKKNGTYEPPSYENNEVGVALALATPHSAIQDNGLTMEWSVELGDGSHPPVVDKK
ncbi:Z1 domain-containing protein [Corynebacterium dentalis]|uniref:Z1 domain-containing protein n=1 Tax=Corynebacterium dentalis TaxID=2014528 RepID=UPI00289A4E9A|nr:Z1 domain-containing protein [Corynebacterium dentalis]